MRIRKNIKVPTGNILVVEGERGLLECLSLGDYGKGVNVKADFLGLEREVERVTHTEMLPLEEKWVVTTSSQYGCSMNCKFCDVPKAGSGINATHKDIIDQVFTTIALHPEVTYTKRLNHHHARMGEPTWNPAVLTSTVTLSEQLQAHFDSVHYHPVVSTMMPKHHFGLTHFLETWCMIKNDVMGGEAGLQLSINSTDEDERHWMFSGNSMPFLFMEDTIKKLPKPIGRKYTLNFAIAQWEIDPDTLLEFFDPEDWICKLTPMHKTDTALSHDIKTEGDYTEFYPYRKDEDALKEAGYDVLVFVASEYEDLGRITCGNALLGGSEPQVPLEVIYDDLQSCT
jgi:23S rRNA (adenine2503-C2)-methyltransferase